MPRAPRIEFENACYHIMARGNQRAPIVFSDDDRKLFVKTLGEAAQRCGWEVFAWVLMTNHYHFVVRTPQPNLIEGMQWFQNAYTRRINSRNQLWGHLFGGRYRSILIENRDIGGKVRRDYLRTVIDYVHLNPGRAGLVDGSEKSCREYSWSSLAQGFNLPPSRRAKWLQVTEVLDLYGFRDDARGRRRLFDRYDEWIADENGYDPEVDGISVASRIKRGWYWGSEAFKENLLDRLKTEPTRTSRDYRSSETIRDSHEKRAMEILKEAESHFKSSRDEIRQVIRNDWTRAAVAWAIWQETIVSQSWIAEKLNLKSAANASQQIRRFAKVEDSQLPKSIRSWRKSRNVA